MRSEIIDGIREGVYARSPIIHCITNPISINQCANAVLAVGARPMMAEHPSEVGEITPTAGGLLLNLGNITDVRMESMLTAGKCAKERGIPVVIDAVGGACSSHRLGYAQELIETAAPAVLKGNYSEITALVKGGYRSPGVDADRQLTLSEVKEWAVRLAEKYGTVVLASGKTDIITDGKKVIYVKNGCSSLSRVTGTGCMLGALCACYLTEARGTAGAAAACVVLGICGQLAETEKGNGSFFTGLMDKLSTLNGGEIKKYIDTETEIL